MFLLWLEETPLTEIGRKCGLNVNTVSEYKAKDEWDKRKAKIIADARNEVDLKATTSLIKEARAIDAILGWLISKTVNRMKAGGDKLTLPALLKELRETIDTKVKLKEVIDPEIPPEIPKDEMAGAIQNLGEAAIKALAKAAAEQLSKVNAKA